MFNVLVVEDDIKLNQLIVTALNKNKYQAMSARDGMEALEVFERSHIDLIISDIMMPNMDGYDLASAIREYNSSIPILFVSAKDGFEDKQKGFKLGIDDYMVKPIDINELTLRVGALLRRAQIANEKKLVIGDTFLDYETMTATFKGKEVELPQKEFFILFKLLSFPNKIFTRTQLMDEFWGVDSESCERTVDVHITRLRDKFKEASEFDIVTVRGLGYKAIVHNK